MKKRETGLDILRIGAMLMVILVHVCGAQIKTLPVTDTNWQVLVLLQSLVTWEVPVFVMISGRFFLDPDRNVTFGKIGKAIRRLALAFLLWDVIYFAYYVAAGTYPGLNWKGILSQALQGPYHFWYLWMLICMYAITPFLRKICLDKKLMEYFIILFLVFQFIAKCGPHLPVIGATVEMIISESQVIFDIGFPGYYILGYYLYKYPVSRKVETALYIAGGILLLTAASANVLRSIREGVEGVWYTQYLLPNIVIESAAVYTFAVKRLSRLRLSERAIRRITTLSEYSFGVYLIHALVIEFYARLGLSPTLIHPLVMVPLITVLVYASSHLAAVLLRKIPCVGKWMT